MPRDSIMLFVSLLHLFGPIQFLFYLELLVGANTSKKKCKDIILRLSIKATSKERDSNIMAFIGWGKLEKFI